MAVTSATAAAPLNVARRLRLHAERAPDKAKLYFPDGVDAQGAQRYAHQTLREIDATSDAYAHGFAELGIARGTKTILMVKPGPELFAITFALFKLGAVPVVVDPGMGVARMLHCYDAVGAEAFIGIPIGHVVRVASPRVFAALKTWITVGKRWFWGGKTLAEVAEAGRPRGAFPIAETTADDLLIINFTTGSTGPAKGVEYTHGIAAAMVEHIGAMQGPDDVSLATLPLFAIFDLLVGSTSVLPPMDPTKPARVDAHAMIDAIRRFGVTQMFASPAFLHRVGEHAHAVSVTLPTLKRVISGGAPVATSIVERFRALLPDDALLETTYGATEALPIASIEAREILAGTDARTRAGEGTCVGLPTRGLDVKILRISDDPFPTMSDELLARPGDVGEIAIAGPNVSTRYHGAPRDNERFKIADGKRIWHRTGDLGRVDNRGRIWFAGRKTQRVVTAHGTLFSVQWEGVFNAHPDVYRTALVGVGPRGAQDAVVCVELRGDEAANDRPRIERELREMAAAHPLTARVRAFLFHPGFPVDIRHNAKIGREELARWAALMLGAAPKRRASWLWAIPIAGWLFIVFGLFFPLEHPTLRLLWRIDVFLSVVVHGLQCFVAVPLGRRNGYSVFQTVAYTLLLGATWWKPLQPSAELPPTTMAKLPGRS